MTQHQQRGLAWCYADGVVLGLSVLIGIGAWIAASLGIAHSASAGDDAPWINLGIAGVIIFGAGNALWLLRGRRAVALLRASLVGLESAGSQDPTTTLLDDGSPVARVWLPGGSMIHRPSCPLVAGKRVVSGQHPSGRACGVCSP